MPARDVTDGIGHGQDRQAEGHRHTDEADPEFGETGGNNGAAKAPKTSQNLPKNSAESFFIVTPEPFKGKSTKAPRIALPGILRTRPVDRARSLAAIATKRNRGIPERVTHAGPG
jgi:hypothetical protein